jgi:hypothetical protein
MKCKRDAMVGGGPVTYVPGTVPYGAVCTGSERGLISTNSPDDQAVALGIERATLM